MQTIELKPGHYEKLAEYNLQGLPAGSYRAVCYAPGERIARAGAEMGSLAIVVSGMAKVYRTAPNGKTLILCYYLSDGVIGEIELLTRKEAATTTVTAISAFECVMVDMRACQAELKTNILFVERLGATLAEKLEISTDNYLLSALCTGEARLCQYILHNAPRDIFSDVLTEVACSIGTSYRHLLRMLAQLCRDGLLQKTAQGFRIPDREALKRRCRAA